MWETPVFLGQQTVAENPQELETDSYVVRLPLKHRPKANQRRESTL